MFSKILGVWPDAFFTFNENERFFGSDETSPLIRSGALEKSSGAFAAQHVTDQKDPHKKLIVRKR